MSLAEKIRGLYALENLSARDNWLCAVHPLAKLLACLAYVISLLSFGRHELAALAPYFLCILLLMAAADIPFSAVFKRALISLPFCLLAALSNLIFERQAFLQLGSWALPAGLFSFASILLRTLLCVSAVLVLVASTPLRRLSASLLKLRVPFLFVAVLEMCYRYLAVLADDAGTMHLAYQLRSGKDARLQMKHMGSFVGVLFLRSYDRSERIYNAMLCRGYGRAQAGRESLPFRASDWAFLISSCGLCVLFRRLDLTLLLGRFALELSAKH